MILFGIIMSLGLVLYYYYGQSISGGIGLSCCVFSMISFFHFFHRENKKEKNIESKMTWFLLFLSIAGVMLIFSNSYLNGPAFYEGMGVGICLIAAITYCIELFSRFIESVR